jgi:hypothetical protein
MSMRAVVQVLTAAGTALVLGAHAAVAAPLAAAGAGRTGMLVGAGVTRLEQGQPSAQRPASTRSQEPASKPERPQREPDDLGVSLDRIRRGLERQPSGILDPSRPTFQVYIEGRLPTFSEFYANEDFSGGPAGWVPRGHQEFLDMVTPREAQPFGAFTGTDLLLVGAQSLASGVVANALFNTIPRAIREARRSREEAEARREVQEVLAELARRKAEAETGAARPSDPDSKPVP